MVRTWGFQTITGNAQPLFGDALTAAFSNIIPPNGLYQVTVASTAKYILGDRIILGWNSGSPTNILKVDQIISGTVLGCQSEGNAPVSNWANATKIALDVACYGLQVTGKSGNAASIWLGSDGSVTSSGGGNAFFEIAKVTAGTPQTPYQLFKYDGQDALRSTEFCLAGTAADSFAAALFIN